VEAGGSKAPRFDPEQEVRFAVVLYGGASLAIYMYGIAEELFRLVRSTAPKVRPAGASDELAYETPQSTEEVYREIATMLPFGPSPSDGTRVRTRFVVDVIAGTSAGGINGVCLAKALANGSSLEGLRKLWLNDGDIGVLVADRRSAYEDAAMQTLVDGLQADFEAKSVLNADRMLMRLISAFREMDAPDPQSVPPLVDELDLWVTATDLDGKRLPIQLSNRVVSEKRFANRYHFRVSPQDRRNDFENKDNPFLSFAARCTSAFPFAFEAMRLGHLADFANVPPLDAAWQRFYPEYAPDDFPARRFSDGGILDNKPFSYATGALVARRAPLPVDRKLVYVEPDPSAGGEEAPPGEWNGLQTAQAALLSIPRAEGIRNDIQAVLNRNRTIERVRDILAQAAADAPESAVIEKLLSDDGGAGWAQKSLAETIRDQGWGVGYASYHRLKVRGLVDYLALLVVRANGLDPDSDDLLAVHYLVRAWKEANYAEDPSGTRASENQLLLDLSLPYRWRRLDYVMKRLRELRSPDPAVVARALEGAGLPGSLPPGGDHEATFLDLRAKLTLAADTLYEADRKLASPESPLAAFDLKQRNFRTVLATPDDRSMLARAEAVVADLGADAFDAVTRQVMDEIRGASRVSREQVDAALGPPVSQRRREDATGFDSAVTYALRFYYDAFEAFDAILYPLEFGTDIAETNPVEIRRISPLECELPGEVKGEARVLRGTSINHFGAFFNAEWRKHDMLWGRLNGSESLIRALLPKEHPDLPKLIERAHRRIVEDFAALQEPTPVPRERAWEWFVNDYPKGVPAKADRDPTLEVLDRGAVVTGKVLGGALPAKVSPAWKLIASVLRPNPGGAKAVFRLARAIFLGTWPGQLALGTWIVLLVAGIALVATDTVVALGITLLVLAALFAAAAVGGLWIAVAKLRAMVDKRVGAFNFGP
jgi:patatin-related protein